MLCGNKCAVVKQSAAPCTLVNLTGVWVLCGNKSAVAKQSVAPCTLIIRCVSVSVYMRKATLPFEAIVSHIMRW